jgi:hypothetical protein
MHNIGFVQDVRRLNTAISRAICLLVMVGDERILSKSNEWRDIIRVCKENGAYISTDAQAEDGAEGIVSAVPSAKSATPEMWFVPQQMSSQQTVQPTPGQTRTPSVPQPQPAPLTQAQPVPQQQQLRMEGREGKRKDR